MSRLSLAELAHLDDPVIADALGELLQRRRCGIAAAERYSVNNDSGGGGG